MKSNKKNTGEEYFLSYLRSLGFLFPETEKELDRFNNLFSDFQHKLDGKEVSPKNIIDKVASEEKRIKPTIHKKNITNTRNLYFKRIVLAAEITSQLYNEPTFGHVKFQKLFYLCEKLADIKLQ